MKGDVVAGPSSELGEGSGIRTLITTPQTQILSESDTFGRMCSITSLMHVSYPSRMSLMTFVVIGGNYNVSHLMSLRYQNSVRFIPVLYGRYSRRVRARMNLRRLHASMSRRRINRYPGIPDTLRDLTRELLGNAGISKTVDDLENLYAGSITAADGSHHVAFFSPRMLRFLGNLKLIQADGTFRARPALPPSRQCFVLVTTWRHSVSACK